MSQFYPRLLPLFRDVIVLVQKPLAAYLRAFPHLRVVTDLAGVSYDYWCPTMSLPLMLGIKETAEIRAGPGWQQGARRGEGPVRVGSTGGQSALRVRRRSLHPPATSGDAAAVRRRAMGLAPQGSPGGGGGSIRAARAATRCADFLDTAEFSPTRPRDLHGDGSAEPLGRARRPDLRAEHTDPDWRWSSWYRAWRSAAGSGRELVRGDRRRVGSDPEDPRRRGPRGSSGWPDGCRLPCTDGPSSGGYRKRMRRRRQPLPQMPVPRSSRAPVRRLQWGRRHAYRLCERELQIPSAPGKDETLPGTDIARSVWREFRWRQG